MPATGDHMKQSSFLHKYKELLLGVAMVALAGFYLYHAALIKVRSSVSVSAKLVPQILGVLVIILGTAQVAVGISHLVKTRRENGKLGIPSIFMNEKERGDIPPILLTFALIVGYAVSFEWLGFVISSTLCMFLQMMLMAPRAKRRPGFFALVSAVTAVVVYIAFRKGLSLSLPRGLLEVLPF